MESRFRPRGGNETIQQNVVSESRDAGLTLHADATGGAYIVENNTFYKNGYEEIGTAGTGALPMTLLNNSFFGNNDMLLNGALTASSIVGYNDYYNVRLPATTGGHSITANPLFVIPGINFNLQSTSPAVAVGTNVGLPYSGRAPDMDAF